MFHWREEAEEVKQGFNLYHPTNKHSIGGVLRVGNHTFRIRWSKNANRFFGGYYKMDPKALEKQRMWDILHGTE